MYLHDPKSYHWIGPIDEYGVVGGCLPLSGGAIGVAVLFLAWGSYNIYEAASDDGQISFDDSSDIVVGVVKIIGACFGLVGIVLRWYVGVKGLIVSVQAFAAATVCSCVLRVCQWLMAYNGNTSRDEETNETVRLSQTLEQKPGNANTMKVGHSIEGWMGNIVI